MPVRSARKPVVPRTFALVLVSATLAACAGSTGSLSTADVSTTWTPVLAADANIGGSLPGLAGMAPDVQRRRTTQGGSLLERARWTVPGESEPRAEFIWGRLTRPDRIITELSPQPAARRIAIRFGSRVKYAERAPSGDAVPKSQTVMFTLDDDKSCAYLRWFYFRNITSGGINVHSGERPIGNNFVEGVYCRAPGESLDRADVKAVKQAVRVP